MVVFDILSTSVDLGFKRSRVRVRPGDVLVYDVVGLYGGGVDLQLRRVHILVTAAILLHPLLLLC